MYIYDPNAVVTGDNQPITGCERPLQPSDFAAVISGGVTIGNVGVTGGNVTINSGSYTPTFSFVTNGQVQIPGGAKQASVTVSSGTAAINGSTIPVGTVVKLGGYDGRFILAGSVNVGCTGSAFVSWET
jgi:hypothetical protein